MSGFPPLRTALSDGTPVLIREATPADADLIRMGFAQLSDRSRQFRFLRAMPELADADLSFLAAPDSEAQEALGALDLMTDPPTPVALARYVVLPNRMGAAEVAITVVDSHQGRGLGSMLFGCLCWHARRRGLTCFVALVSDGNVAMRGLLTELGGSAEPLGGGEIEFTLPIRASAEEWPATPAGRAFARAWRLTEVAAAS
ncbi:MAG: GNAT family N-acetyltransferase [Rhodobacteraceae bacterium]|nr:GNAT family N-acetyltransferase [Paracoccaceae bacterium]